MKNVFVKLGSNNGKRDKEGAVEVEALEKVSNY